MPARKFVRSRARLVGLGLLVGALALAAVSPTAQAAQIDPLDDGGGSTPGGYTVEVSIKLTGEAAPGGGTTVRRYVAPICWWQPAWSGYTDAVASLGWYDGVSGGAQTRGVIGEYGPRRIWKEAADAEAAGTADVSWYRAFCVNPKDYERYDAGSAEGVDPVLGNPENFVTYYYRAFAAGAAVPDPLVDPAELARVARDEMEIPVPEIGRNPKINAPGAPTLVGLPTWFWAENPPALGNGDGLMDIRAELGPVWATVTAKTGGLHLDSPAGGKTCVPADALIKYSPGATDSPCTVEFARASVAYPGGYPVAASTNWQATWVGSGNPVGGVLDPLARTTTINVPVAEVQNIVTRSVP